MTLEEKIEYVQKLISNYEIVAAGNPNGKVCYIAIMEARKQRELLEWLRELKIHREIHEILLQMLLDSDIDICCDDLMDDAEEKKKCEENCNNKSMNCWVRWAKLKAREKNADGDNN